ncbi:hypothetical protein Cgig2_000561 [Carnegiea gigantea]|uniref:Uncharacterized protein n=1 Tax=Carnegiea gigantea TaxID=171969 RepID=A0A9Q1JFM9_9CARY|nr:hypothetical protein Cgig2_000561 [Carnegiea gigantea]
MFGQCGFSLAQLIQVIILPSTGGKNSGGYKPSKYVVTAFHGGILLLHAILNRLPISWLSFFGQLGAAWNSLLGFCVCAHDLIPLVAKEKASAKFVFTHFNSENGDYVFVPRLRISQDTFTGYDASAAMHSFDLKFQSNIWPNHALASTQFTQKSEHLPRKTLRGDYAVAEVFYLAFKSRYGNGIGGILCLGIVAVAILFCRMSSVPSNSRMAYAFSRHEAMPFSSLRHKVNKLEVPDNAEWMSACFFLHGINRSYQRINIYRTVQPQIHQKSHKFDSIFRHFIS